ELQVSFSSPPTRQQSGDVRGGTFHRIALLFQPTCERRQVHAWDPRIKVVLSVIVVVEIVEKWPLQYVATIAGSHISGSSCGMGTCSKNPRSWDMNRPTLVAATGKIKPSQTYDPRAVERRKNVTWGRSPQVPRPAHRPQKRFVPCRIATYRLPQSIIRSGNIPSRHKVHISQGPRCELRIQCLWQNLEARLSPQVGRFL